MDKICKIRLNTSKIKKNLHAKSLIFITNGGSFEAGKNEREAMNRLEYGL